MTGAANAGNEGEGTGTHIIAAPTRPGLTLKGDSRAAAIPDTMARHGEVAEWLKAAPC